MEIITKSRYEVLDNHKEVVLDGEVEKEFIQKNLINLKCVSIKNLRV